MKSADLAPPPPASLPRILALLTLVAASLLQGAAVAQRGGDLSLLSITPSGEEVPPGRQIVLQFDRPVVPIGRMERDAAEIPITIEPELQCEWRWLDTSALACQLDEAHPMAPATTYSLRLRPGLEAQDGARLASEVRHDFTTIRPSIQSAYFRQWRGPGWPRIYVHANQRIGGESLREHLYLRLRDGGERIPVMVRAPGEEDEEVAPGREDRSWVVEPERELPPDEPVHLRIAPGLSSAEGPERSLEDRLVVEFWTFPEPRFLGLRCIDNDDDVLLLGVEESGSGARRCNPLRSVSLRFSSPILDEIVGQHLNVEPDLAGDRQDYDPWEGVQGYSRLRSARREGQTYRVRLPEVLEAHQEYHLRAAARDLLDEFGRPLAEDVDFVFWTDHRRPAAVLTHQISVLERSVPSHVPLVVTNLDRVEVSYRGVRTDGALEGTVELEPPAVEDVAFPVPLEARSWLDDRSGALLGNVRSRPTTGDPRLFLTQVTPFQVHAKLGHLDTAVWVTDLESGKPVRGARVRIYRARHVGLEASPEPLSEATTDESGLALLAGSSQLDPELELRGWLWLDEPEQERLFVRVDHPDGMALLPLVGNFAVRAEGPQNSWIPNWWRRYRGHVKAWGTTAQGVYRLGDTLQFKIWVRDQDNDRFIPPPEGTYSLAVHDPMDKLVFEVEEVELNRFGAFDGSFKIPSNGAVGWYRFQLYGPFPDTLQPLQVLVADFTPAPFRAETELDGELFEPEQTLTVNSRARLHSGGPYGSAEARVTVLLRSTPLLSDNPRTQGFFFDSGPYETLTLHQTETRLDRNGDLVNTYPLPATGVANGRLQVETAVRDDRGKYVAESASARYVGRSRFVGIRQEDWLLESGEPATLQAVVIDPSDRLTSGDRVDVRIEYRETKASRAKGAGNAYLTEYVHRWIEVDTCSETTAGEVLQCTFVPQQAGLYRMTAAVTDPAGRTHSSSLSRWAKGAGHVLWETPPGHHLAVEPEKSEYDVGETARFLIRNPFPGAEALVTIERLGIQRSFARRLETSTEVLEIEVEPDFIPGFYLSVLVTSPRVADKPLEEGVDLGKPAFRLGYVRVPVRDPLKRIDVEVTPGSETYRPRERAVVDLTASLRYPAERDEIELAVAVLDEAVFDLVAGGEAAFDPYLGLYDLEALDLQNFNLLTHLIGIQKFDKKGADSGGGGGAGPDLRSLFKFVAYWNPSLEVDAEGRARIELELPDNLTGWRVLAMAATPGDRLGLGQGTFTVNQPVELRPALPNQLTEGDEFEARFTVMNRTQETRELVVRAAVDGVLESSGLAARQIEAEPFQRYTVGFPVLAKAAGVGDLTIWATSDSGERDALRLPLEVQRRAALRVAANYGTTLERQVTERVAIPEDVRDDVGSLDVQLSPTVLGGLDGAVAYGRDYPYVCWEQRLSKGVLASHYAQLRDYISPDFSWEGHEDVPRRTLEDAANFQAPNGGMTYWIPADRYVSPYLSAYTALAFSWLREHGHDIPSAVEEKLHAYLDRLLRTDAFPSFFSRGMASSVRAVALAALAREGKLSLDQLRRYRRSVEEMDLFGKAHYLQAAVILGDETLQREVRELLLAHSNRTGGKLVFSESVDTSFARILHSAPRSNCAVLSALLAEQAGQGPESATGLGDIPFRLTRSLVQERQRRDHWENTQENVFCLQSFIDFSRGYESVAPDMTVRVEAGGKRLGKASFEDLRDPAVAVGRPLGRRDPGRELDVRIERIGTGRLYYTTRLSYSPSELPRESTNAGMEIYREYSVERQGEWVLLEDPMTIDPGELVRVDLYLSVPAARNFVVVDDPVPGGLEPVNRELATASQVDADKGEFQRSQRSFWWSRDDWYAFSFSRWSFYHQELRHDAVRFYSDYLPAGGYHLSYVAQAIAPGSFVVLPSRAEEMYDPDVYALGVPAQLEVRQEEESP